MPRAVLMLNTMPEDPEDGVGVGVGVCVGGCVGDGVDAGDGVVDGDGDGVVGDGVEAGGGATLGDGGGGGRGCDDTVASTGSDGAPTLVTVGAPAAARAVFRLLVKVDRAAALVDRLVMP